MNLGDYIRTKDGIIDKVIIKYNGRCANPTCNRKHVSCERDYYDEDEIIKSSPQIIDLIEVGDYVNGIKVDEIKNRQLKTASYYDGYICHFCNEEDIKTIVTHEQMEDMQYRVEE